MDAKAFAKIAYYHKQSQKNGIVCCIRESPAQFENQIMAKVYVPGRGGGGLP